MIPTTENLMSPAGGAPNTPAMGGAIPPAMGGAIPPAMGGAIPPAVNPSDNRLDAIMNTAGATTGMGGTLPMSEDPMLEGMDTGVVPEPTEIVEGFASSVMELTNGSVEGAVSLLQSTIDTLLSSQSEDLAMGQDAGRIEELLGGLPV